MTRLLGSSHHVNTPRIHWSAGTVEILQRRTKLLYRKLCSELHWAVEQARWLMPAVQMAINFTPDSYDLVPATVMTGQTVKGPLSCIARIGGTPIRDCKVQLVTSEMYARCTQQIDEVRTAMQFLHRRAVRTKVESRKDKRDRIAGRKKSRRPRLNVGDYVLAALPEQRTHKYELSWHGPWRIERPINPPAYSVRSSFDYDGPNISDCTRVYEISLQGQPTTTKVVHISRMRKFHSKLIGANAPLDKLLAESAQHDFSQFVIDAIIGHDCSNGEVKLKVRWLGFDVGEATFEPIANLDAA